MPAPLWTCPKCGARLITRNLSHSCGTFSLDALFAKSPPEVMRAPIEGRRLNPATRRKG